jgi:hypothetical protein
VVEVLIESKDVIRLKSISLSNSTMSRIIGEMADDVRDQLIQKIKERDFIIIQFDESIVVSNLAQF